MGDTTTAAATTTTATASALAESAPATTDAASTQGSAPTEEASTQAADATAGTAEGTPETQQAPRRMRLRIDGQDEEHDEEEVIKLAQKYRAADRRFDEAHKLREEVRQRESELAQIERRLSADPLIRAYLERGEDGVMEALVQRLEYESLPLEERRRHDEETALRTKAQRYDEIERRQREAAAEREREQKTAAMQRAFEEEARASLAAAGLDPADPETMERWIVTRMVAMRRGEQMTAEQAAQRVAALLGRTRESLIGKLTSLEGDALLRELPEALLTRIRAADAARLTAAQRARNPANGQFVATKPAPQATAKPKRQISTERWLSTMRTQGVDAANRLLEEGE